jgi:hypothetical protein
VPSEEIIVLASSSKIRGRCIAGISTSSGEWIRPVSGFQEGELYPFHCRVNGRIPAPLDIVRFIYDRRLHDPAQPENVLIEDGPWDLIGELKPDEAYDRLKESLDPGPELFGNRGRSVSPAEAEAGMEASLTLIEPDEIHFALKPPYYPGGRSKARVLLELAGQEYDLPVTDFYVKPQLMTAGHGEHSQGDVGLEPAMRTLVTASLGSAKYGAHWKLAAAFLSVD